MSEKEKLQEAIALFEAGRKYSKSGTIKINLNEDGYDVVLSALREKLESPRDWTPCAQGMPQNGQEVLFDVICDMNIGDLYGVYKGKYEDGVFWIDEHDHKSYIGAPKETVTEWMPCPKSHRADDTTGKVQEDAEPKFEDRGWENDE